MNWNITNIFFTPLCDIVVDPRFVITDGSVSRAVLDAVRNDGLRTPIVTLPHPERNGCHSLVTGHDYLLAATECGLTTVPCLKADENLTSKDLFLMNLRDVLTRSTLNPVETALCLDKGLALFDPDEVTGIIMPLAGLKPSKHMMERMLGLLNLIPELRTEAAAGKIPASNAAILARLHADEQKAFHGLYEKTMPGVNLQKEFLENLVECARRDVVTIANILSSPPLIRILHDPDMGVQEKAALARLALREMRYPRLSNRSHAFQGYVDQLGLPPEIKWEHPPFFEDTEHRLIVRFESGGELLSLLDRLKKAVREHPPDDVL